MNNLLGDYQCMDSLEERISVFFSDDSSESDRSFDGDWTDDVDESSSGESQNSNERTEYWESQEALLQEILERYCSTGSKLRQQVNRVIEMARETDFCDCPKPSSNGCNYCLRRRVVNLLCERGFNATLCTSRWKRTHKFPGGSHEYIEVIASAPGRKKQIPFLIELEFRDEFEMAKACDEYRKLISLLPESYIGKPDHLKTIVCAVCDAAKISSREKKIHMGPWRKKSFMQMKWSSSYEKWSFDQSLNKNPLLSSRPVLAPIVGSCCLHISAATAVVVT